MSDRVSNRIRARTRRAPLDQAESNPSIHLLAVVGSSEGRVLPRALGEWDLPLAFPDVDGSEELLFVYVLDQVVNYRLRLIGRA